MKKTLLFSFFLTLALGFVGCNDDDDDQVTIERLAGRWKMVKAMNADVNNMIVSGGCSYTDTTDVYDEILEILPNGYIMFISPVPIGPDSGIVRTDVDRLQSVGNNVFRTYVHGYYKCQLSDHNRTLTIGEYHKNPNTNKEEISMSWVHQRQPADNSFNPLVAGYWKLTKTAFGDTQTADTTVVSDDDLEFLEILTIGSCSKLTERKGQNSERQSSKCSTKGDVLIMNDSVFYKYQLLDDNRTLVLKNLDPENNAFGPRRIDFQSWIYQRTTTTITSATIATPSSTAASQWRK